MWTTVAPSIMLAVSSAQYIDFQLHLKSVHQSSLAYLTLSIGLVFFFFLLLFSSVCHPPLVQGFSLTCVNNSDQRGHWLPLAASILTGEEKLPGFFLFWSLIGVSFTRPVLYTEQNKGLSFVPCLSSDSTNQVAPLAMRFWGSWKDLFPSLRPLQRFTLAQTSRESAPYVSWHPFLKDHWPQWCSFSFRL